MSRVSIWKQIVSMLQMSLIKGVDSFCRRQYNISPFSYLKSNRQAALVLFPTDWAVTNAEPLAPHMVAVGAITAAPAKALPSELEEFMQSAGDHGVVYASLGTTAIPGDSLQLGKVHHVHAWKAGVCIVQQDAV